MGAISQEEVEKMAKKIKKAFEKKSDILEIGDAIDYIIDNTMLVEVPGWNGKKIKVKRMSLQQMIDLKKEPAEKQQRIMLKHAFDLSDKDIDRLEKEGDGIKLSQLSAAMNLAYKPTDETVKK